MLRCTTVIDECRQSTVHEYIFTKIRNVNVVKIVKTRLGDCEHSQ